MDIKCYKKKPVVIRAVIADKGQLVVVAQWCGGKVQYAHNGEPEGIKISTLEGDMKASLGDFVIEGISGEYYPCKPDIFDKTYEECIKKGT